MDLIRTLLAFVFYLGFSSKASTQVSFKNASHLLHQQTTSGVPIGVIDMNGLFFRLDD